MFALSLRRGAVQTRERLAYMLGVPMENCHVVFGDMGGILAHVTLSSQRLFLCRGQQKL